MIQCPACRIWHVENTLFCAECGAYLAQRASLATDLLEESQDSCPTAPAHARPTGPLTIRLRINAPTTEFGRRTTALSPARRVASGQLAALSERSASGSQNLPSEMLKDAQPARSGYLCRSMPVSEIRARAGAVQAGEQGLALVRHSLQGCSPTLPPFGLRSGRGAYPSSVVGRPSSVLRRAKRSPLVPSTHELEISLARPIRLGRIDPIQDIFPEVDLSRFHGREQGVSREHVCIFRRGDRIEVQDLASSNGTLLNGRRLSPYRSAPLQDGDRLQLGKLLIEVGIAGSEEATSVLAS